MSNFKLKHQRKSGLFNTKGEEYDPGIKEGVTPGIKIEPLRPKLFIPKEPMRIAPMVEPAAIKPEPRIVQKPYKKILREPLQYEPIEKLTFSKPEVLELPDQYGNTDPRAKNMAMVIAKHQRQDEEAARRRAEELTRQAEYAEIMRKSQEHRRQMAEANRLLQLDKAQVVDDSGINMMKNNSATPYKLPHQRKTALHNNGFIASGGELTDDERAKAIELLDSTMNTYMNRDYKRKGRFDPETRKVVFENVPMSEEENLAEWNREKGEYYVDFDNEGNAKVLNIPRGDDDIPVQSFIKSLDPSQYRGTIPTDDQLPEDYDDPGLDPNSVLNPFKGYQRIKNYRQR